MSAAVDAHERGRVDRHAAARRAGARRRQETYESALRRGAVDRDGDVVVPDLHQGPDGAGAGEFKAGR